MLVPVGKRAMGVSQILGLGFSLCGFSESVAVSITMYRWRPLDKYVAVKAGKVKDWSVGETMEWLGQQGLARYATTFAENSIDGELLLQLTNADLRDELKIVSFGDRKKLDLLIQQLKES